MSCWALEEKYGKKGKLGFQQLQTRIRRQTVEYAVGSRIRYWDSTLGQEQGKVRQVLGGKYHQKKSSVKSEEGAI